MASELILILLSTMLVNNVALVQLLGLCPFMGLSNKLDAAVGMSLVTLCIFTLSSTLSYLLFTYLLKPLHLEYLQIISFMLVILIVAQLTDIIVKSGVFLPLIITNCAVLGLVLLNVRNEELTLFGSMMYGLGAAAGFSLVLILFAAMRERIALADVPEPFKGAAIHLITAGLMALAFMGFSGLVNLT